MSKHQRGACVRVKPDILKNSNSEEFRRYSSFFLDINYGMFGQSVSNLSIRPLCFHSPGLIGGGE
jgi:hypothetical protein